MLLVIDIGNTNIVSGVFNGQELILTHRIKTDHHKTLDEYWATLTQLWQHGLGVNYSFNKAVICSVVPPLTGVFNALCKDRLNLPTLVVGPGIKTGLTIKTSDPAAVGADRVVNSLAARELYGCPAIVIDFGTATTFDVIDKNGAYLGGAIAPGLQVALDALVTRTSKLPKIELIVPEKAIGNDTVSAMRSGCMLGYACMVDGLVARMQQEMADFKYVIATGGLAVKFSSVLECNPLVDSDLTLKGLKILADLNFSK